MLVAVAGAYEPAHGFVGVSGHRGGGSPRALPRIQQALAQYLVTLNLVLMCFNLLPIPPLDGGAVLAWVLPRSMHGIVDFLQRYGFLILLLLVLSPWRVCPS